MDLRDKLKYYQSSSEPEKLFEKNLSSGLAELLNGIILNSESKYIIKIENRIPLEYVVPDEQKIIDDFLNLKLVTKSEFSEPLNIKNILIFDLETTGLAGGTGTYPFLQGFGYFEDRNLVVVQYFLTDFGQDDQLYSDLSSYLDGKSILLSYNGKSYDYPLLRNRFVLNRMNNPFESFMHLDLLYPVRRIWKYTLENCSLQQVERGLFNFHRIGDIDGALIPQAYFSFLSTQNGDDIQNIVSHNLQDIITLARLLFHINSIENSVNNSINNHSETFALCRLAIQHNDLTTAQILISSLSAQNAKTPASLWVDYSLLLKKNKFWNEAIVIWQNLLESGNEILFAAEEMAKYYEHQMSDFEKAGQNTKRALKYIDMMLEINNNGLFIELREQFTHRLERILSKSRKIS